MDAKKKESSAIINLRGLRVLLIIAAACFLIFQWQHTFTIRRWMDNPNGRSAIVDSMLSRCDLIGMTREEVIALLGPDSSADTNHLTYELGSARGWLPIDLERLDIQLENGVVSDYTIIRYG